MNRFRYVLFCAAVSSLLIGCVHQGAEEPVADSEYIIFTGTNTRQESKGIYAYRFQPSTGQLTSIGLAAETANPTFLALAPNREFLYAVNETGEFEGQPTGSISAYSIDHETGKLILLNRVSSRGSGPCHLALDKTGKCLLVANYNDGSIAAFPVKEDGSLGEASAFVQHSGSSVDPRRQRGPHAHEVVLSPDNRFVLVPDLGLDQVLVYRLNPSEASLTPNDPPFNMLTPGSGPRHLAFHPSGQYVYVINELLSTVSAFSYNPDRGSFEELQTTSTLPEGFTGRNSTAEVAVHPNGRYLYGSNRGHDSIAVFTIDADKGTLTTIEQVPTQGRTPRNFAIDPMGVYLFAANQDSNNIVLFRIDQETGQLTPTSEVLQVPSPVCVVFVPAQ